MAETQSTEHGAHQVMEPSDDAGEFVEATELLHADAGDISAARVTLEQSTAKSITADHVSMDRSAIKSVNAQTATMSQAASLKLTASDVAAHESALGVVSGQRVDVFDSVVGVVRGPVTVGEGKAQIFVQIGPANSSVKPVLNAQSALGLGAGFGASIVILSRLLRRLLGN